MPYIISHSLIDFSQGCSQFTVHICQRHQTTAPLSTYLIGKELIIKNHNRPLNKPDVKTNQSKRVRKGGSGELQSSHSFDACPSLAPRPGRNETRTVWSGTASASEGQQMRKLVSAFENFYRPPTLGIANAMGRTRWRKKAPQGPPHECC